MTWTTRECGISLDRLSPRELEVAEHMVRGRDTREISQALGISPRTVEIHRSSVIAKMGAANSNHACAMIAVARPDILTRPKP